MPFGRLQRQMRPETGCQRTGSTPRETAPPGDVHSRRSSVSCAGLGPPFAVSRLPGASRRSHGSLPARFRPLFARS
jgi:hypothetical protein